MFILQPATGGRRAIFSCQRNRSTPACVAAPLDLTLLLAPQSDRAAVALAAAEDVDEQLVPLDAEPIVGTLLLQVDDVPLDRVACRPLVGPGPAAEVADAAVGAGAGSRGVVGGHGHDRCPMLVLDGRAGGGLAGGRPA